MPDGVSGGGCFPPENVLEWGSSGTGMDTGACEKSEKEFFGRQAGESRNGGDGPVDIEHFENRIVGGPVLGTQAFVGIDHFLFDRQIVLKDRDAGKPYPCFLGGGHRQLDMRVVFQLVIDILAVAGTEPEPVVFFETEFERAYLGLAIHSDGCQKLDRIFLQEPDDDFHVGFPRAGMMFSVFSGGCRNVFALPVGQAPDIFLMLLSRNVSGYPQVALGWAAKALPFLFLYIFVPPSCENMKIRGNVTEDVLA